MTQAAVDADPRNAETLRRIIESARFQRTLTALILINAVTLGLETSDAIMARLGSALIAADRAIVGVFVLEILAKIAVYRRRFVRDPWNVFDFVVIGLSGPARDRIILGVARVSRAPGAAPGVSRAEHAVGGDGAAQRHPGDGDHRRAAVPVVLRVLGGRDTTVRRGLRGMVRLARRLDVHPVPDHDARWLVHGHRASGDDRVSVGMGILRAAHHRQRLRGPEPVRRDHRERHVDRSVRGEHGDRACRQRAHPRRAHRATP
jgi:hypothetical protein